MSTVAEPQGGLRERKKRATCNAIERAGVALALEKGHANVTVADICERAEVSRSTFFNYMPSREAAIFGRPIPLADPPLVELVLERSGDVPMTTALLRVLFASVGHSWVHPEVSAWRLRLGREQPETETLIAGPVTALLNELAGFVSGWFARHPERRGLPSVDAEREAGYLTLLTGAALRSALHDVAGTEDTVLPEPAFEAAVAEIATLAAACGPEIREERHDR